MASRIKYKITDMDKLKAVFPEVVTEEKIVRNVVDKEKLYKIVKTMHSIGRTIDGVEMEDTAEPQLDLTSDKVEVGTEQSSNEMPHGEDEHEDDYLPM